MAKIECPYWVTARVGGSCMPRREDIDKWAELGVKTVISLAEAWEIEYYGRWGLLELRKHLAERGIKWVHWPTPDGYPPRDLEELVELLKAESSRGTVVVHCVGGMGRTPTALAAYLIATKCLKADDAIREVEKVNPAVSLTDSQYYALLEIEAAYREACRG
ncbi:MAG: dual specificity protein phosphatase family protein [Pyrobaculum arsenaticum]|uniref:protein-tyrosine phosphatase family protein n=2 Tax=Pyrobaculum TaxID=2276 RepID=UPI0022768193|nr:dual specificity protein phosphatase family protein [Pyrobaculum arsenaticum]